MGGAAYFPRRFRKSSGGNPQARVAQRSKVRRKGVLSDRSADELEDAHLLDHPLAQRTHRLPSGPRWGNDWPTIGRQALMLRSPPPRGRQRRHHSPGQTHAAQRLHRRWGQRSRRHVPASASGTQGVLVRQPTHQVPVLGHRTAVSFFVRKSANGHRAKQCRGSASDFLKHATLPRPFSVEATGVLAASVATTTRPPERALPSHPLYPANGAIGVRVCREWRKFEAF